MLQNPRKATGFHCGFRVGFVFLIRPGFAGSKSNDWVSQRVALFGFCWGPLFAASMCFRLFTESNYLPWTGTWVPEAWWVVNLWKHHKLSHDAYLRLSMKLRDGHDRRKACVDAVRSAETSVGFAVERQRAREMIMAKALPFKRLLPAIEQWKMHYEEILERYKMLVLHGPSCTGKSRLARSLFGDSCTLVVDVQHAAHPDLRGYRRDMHKAILLDEMASPTFIVSNKKVLQAHVDGAILGQSATQLYTYDVFVWRTPLMVTTNNWQYDDFSEADKNWIQENCVVVHVPGPVWEIPQRRVDSGASGLKRPISARTPQQSPEHKREAASCGACGQRLPVSTDIPDLM
jgi:hypothetical protein